MVEPTYTTEVPVMSDPYEEVGEAEQEPEPGTLPLRTGSGRANVPVSGWDESV